MHIILATFSECRVLAWIGSAFEEDTNTRRNAGVICEYRRTTFIPAEPLCFTTPNIEAPTSGAVVSGATLTLAEKQRRNAHQNRPASQILMDKHAALVDHSQGWCFCCVFSVFMKGLPAAAVNTAFLHPLPPRAFARNSSQAQ